MLAELEWRAEQLALLCVEVDFEFVRMWFAMLLCEFGLGIKQIHLTGTAMLKEAKELSDKLVAEARDQAKLQANKIIADAQLSIDQQKNAAMVELKNSVGNMVVEVAEKVLRKELSDKAAQETYIRTLASEIPVTRN